MSVDGDGGGSLAAFQITEDLSAPGTWAEMMQEEQMNQPPPLAQQPERVGEKHLRSQDSPLVIVVENLPPEASMEDVYYFFYDIQEGVANVTVADGTAKVDVHGQSNFEKALQKNGESIKGIPVRVTQEKTRRLPVGSNDVRTQQWPTPLPSPSSLPFPSPRFPNPPQPLSDFHRHRPDNFHVPLPNPQAYQGSYGGGRRGGAPRPGNFFAGRPPRRGGCDGGFSDHPHNSNYGSERRNNYGGPLQRSGSYNVQPQNDYNRGPTPVGRSRTESSSSQQERRPLHILPRADSSTSSVSEANILPVKKPTNKDIFGDAKPVDTTRREREVEEKLEQKRKEEKERLLAEEKERKRREEKERVLAEEKAREKREEKERVLAEERAREKKEEEDKKASAALENKNYKILQRPKENEEKGAAECPPSDQTPPLDPVHRDSEGSLPSFPPQYGLRQPAAQRGAVQALTFTRTVKRSQTTSDITTMGRGRGRGGRGGERGGRGGPRRDTARPVYAAGDSPSANGKEAASRGPLLKSASYDHAASSKEKKGNKKHSREEKNPPLEKEKEIVSEKEEKREEVRVEKKESKETAEGAEKTEDGGGPEKKEKKKNAKPPTPRKGKAKSEKTFFASGNKFDALAALAEE